MYGLSHEIWEAAKTEIRQILIGVAQVQTTITYSELAAQMQTISPHPGAYVLHGLLRVVCQEEEAAGRGMLCALVVAKATGRPGQGFFKTMIKIGRDCADLEACWQAEIERLYAVWGAEDYRCSENKSESS